MTTEAAFVIDDLSVPSAALGTAMDVLVLRPPDGQDASGLPWLWMLHGRNASLLEMRPVLASVGEAIAAGRVPPIVVVAPDAPDEHRTSWWVDSTFVPDPAATDVAPGRMLETAVLDDVLPAVEARYGGPTGPAERVVGGISMGGGAALRWLIVRPDLFGAGVLLSAAVFEGLPVDGSTYRRRDVVDVEGDIFDTDRYGELLHYPSLLSAMPPGRPLTPVVSLVGDQERVQNDRSGRHDLELEAARLHAHLKIHPEFTASLRVVGGGHDWPVWERGLVTALRVLAGRED